MKKLLSALLCMAMLFVSTPVVGTAASTLPTTQDYNKYVEKDLTSKYGKAKLNTITKDLKDYPDAKTKKFPDENRTWAKRKGIAGYQTADMNDDGTDDMILFLFDEKGKDNSLSIEYYTNDKKGKISAKEKYQIYSKDDDFMKDIPIANEHVVAGIIKRNGKNVLLVETYYQTAMVSEEKFNVDYSVYECLDDGKFVKSMSYTSSGGDLMIYSERRKDGTYGNDKVPLAGLNNYLTLKLALVNSGFGEFPNDASGLVKAMEPFSQINGFQMEYNHHLYCEDLPTYFATEYESESFYYYTGYVVGQSFITASNSTGIYRTADTKKVFEKYINTTLSPKYGTASNSDITASLSAKQDKKTKRYADKNFTWSKRNGIAGYDFADMNGDLIPDIIVYAFNKGSKCNSFDIMLFSSNISFLITDCGSDTFYERDLSKLTGYYGMREFCTGGIVKGGEKNKVLFECAYTPQPEDNHIVENYVFECDDNGELVRSYYTTNQINSGFMTLYTRNTDGSYSNSDHVLNKGGLSVTQEELFRTEGLPNDPNSTGIITDAFKMNTLMNVPTFMGSIYEKKTFYYTSDLSLNDKSEKIDAKSTIGMFSNDDITEKFESYVKNTLVPKYGMADTEKKEKEIDSTRLDPVPDENRTWTARKGILDYEIADLSDSVYDMAVYIFDKSDPKSNRLYVEFYTSDLKGNIEKNSEFTLYERAKDLIEEYSFDYETCVGGIVEDNAHQKHLVTESYYCPIRCVDYRFDYKIFSWDMNKNVFYNSYKIDQAAYLGVNLYTGSTDGSFDQKHIEHKKDEFFMETVRQVFEDLNFPPPYGSSGDIGKCLGFSNQDLLPSYFNSWDEYRSFYMATYFSLKNDNDPKKIPVTNIAGTFTH